MHIRSRISKAKALAALLAVAMLVLSACGGGSAGQADGGETGPQPGGGGSTDGGATGGLPKTVVIAQGTDAVSMDPARLTGGASLNIAYHITEPLVLFHPDPEQGIIPWLAESWEQPDDLTWVFKLREGVKFHNGAPFNAEAAAYSLERYRDENIPSLKHAYYWDLAYMESVEATGEYELTIKTSEPSPLMLPVLAQMLMSEPGWASTAGHDETNKKLIGTGPFKFVEWVMDDHVRLEANPDYWFGTPLVDELVFRVIPDAGTRIAELLGGGVHVAMDVPMDQIDKINTETTRASVNSGRRIMYLAIKSNDPSLPTYDKRVRQAMNYAVDMEAITQSLMQGYTQPYAGVLTPPNNDPSIQPYPYDPDKARELLAEAGYPDGFEIVIDSPNGRYVKDTEVAQIVASYLNEVGIRATVQTHEWATYTTRMREGNTNAVYLLGNGGFPSSFEELSTIFDPRKNPSAAHGYANPEFQRLMDEANVTVNQDEHVSLLHEAQRILWDDAPAIFGYTQPVAWGISRLLEGYEASPNEYLRLYWTLTAPR